MTVGDAAGGCSFEGAGGHDESVDPLPPVAVIDIDGVLADVRHRLHYLQNRPKDWDGFFAAASSDPAHPEGLALVGQLRADHEVVLVTGRPERLRRVTVEWLEEHELADHQLLMRPDSDRRPAAQVKREILAALARQRTIALVVDDDPMVVAALRDAGHPTVAADWEQRLPEDQSAIVDAQEVEGET